MPAPEGTVIKYQMEAWAPSPSTGSPSSRVAPTVVPLVGAMAAAYMSFTGADGTHSTVECVPLDDADGEAEVEAEAVNDTDGDRVALRDGGGETDRVALSDADGDTDRVALNDADTVRVGVLVLEEERDGDGLYPDATGCTPDTSRSQYSASSSKPVMVEPESARLLLQLEYGV